jgi:hypothetical protein
MNEPLYVQIFLIDNRKTEYTGPHGSTFANSIYRYISMTSSGLE